MRTTTNTVATKDAAPAATDAPAKKRGGAVRKDGKKRKKPVQSYSIYIYKVLKQVHPDTGPPRATAQPNQSFSGLPN